MQFLENRRYRKDVQQWFRLMLGIGQGRVGDRLWDACPWMAEITPEFRQRGVPAVEAAAELMRRLVVGQILRARETERLELQEYLRTNGASSDAPSPLTRIAFSFVHQLYSLDESLDLDKAITESFVNDIFAATQGIGPEEASRMRMERKLAELLLTPRTDHDVR